MCMEDRKCFLMAIGQTLCLFLLFLKGCFGSNHTTSYHGLFPTASPIRVLTSSLAQPNFFNTSTILRSTSSLHLNPTNSTLSPWHFSPNQTISQKRNESTFDNKPTTSPQLRRNISVTSSNLSTNTFGNERTRNETKTVADWTSQKVNSSIVSNVSTRNLVSSQEPSSVQLPLVTNLPRGSDKIFVAKIRILNISVSSEMQNKSSSLYLKTISTIIKSIDYVMTKKEYYKECKVIEIRTSSGNVKLELTMGPGSSNDPNTALDCLQDAIKKGTVGNLTVDPNYFTAWLKKDPKPREGLLSGQLAGVALILFILVVLLLIICLGNFADQPLFNERELFNEEVRMENIGTDRDIQDNEEEEWKFDPLFAWSPKKSFDSKL